MNNISLLLTLDVRLAINRLRMETKQNVNRSFSLARLLQLHLFCTCNNWHTMFSTSHFKY